MIYTVLSRSTCLATTLLAECEEEGRGLSLLRFAVGPSQDGFSLHGLTEPDLRAIRDAIDRRLVQLRPPPDPLPPVTILSEGVGCPGYASVDDVD